MIGIDIIKTSRMERFIERFGNKALKRFLRKEEMELIKSPKTAAGFWAAKEAFSKVLGTGIGKDCSFFDMKIYKDTKGAPKLALSRNIVQQFNIINTALSITHDGEYAVAVVTIERSSPADKVKQF
ncbi:MAG: holo-ACP synthase [Epsilonproteobacteria bacterium]|nr:holo-ACP synthase [Campylobacterota bacterium]